MNRVTLFGTLGRDPELKQAGAASVLRLNLATNERRKDKDGNWSDHTEWHSVVVWGKRADSLAKLLSKGSQVLVDGQLRTTSWEKDGQKRYKTEISATDVELVRKQRGGSEESPPTSKYQAATTFDSLDSDDIPF
jgi:single-strand DNA-binding protein